MILFYYHFLNKLKKIINNKKNNKINNKKNNK